MKTKDKPKVEDESREKEIARHRRAAHKAGFHGGLGGLVYGLKKSFDESRKELEKGESK